MLPDTWKTRRPVSLWRGHHRKQFIARHIGKWCPSTAQQQNLILELDCVPVYFFSHSPWLFESRWIGIGGPFAWPLRTSDLTPVDFFHLDCVKDQVYSQRVNTVDELEVRVTVAIAHVTDDVLQCVWQKLDSRWEVCRATYAYGAHCEVFRTWQLCKFCFKKLFQLMNKILQTVPLYMLFFLSY